MQTLVVLLLELTCDQVVDPESQDLRANAGAKLAAKGADLIVANDVSAPAVGFEHDTNQVLIMSGSGIERDVPLSDKRAVARTVLDAVVSSRANRSPDLPPPTTT